MNEGDTNGNLKATTVTSSSLKQDNNMEPENNKHASEHANGKSDTNGNNKENALFNIKSQNVKQEDAQKNNMLEVDNMCSEDETNMVNCTEKQSVKPELLHHMDNITKWEYAKDRLLNRFDPFHVFQVQCRTCALLSVKVKEGRNISKGSRLQDICDTPDPYIQLNVTNRGTRTTETRQDNVNPVWNQSFNFYIAPDSHHKLEINLIDANAVCADTHLGSQSVDLTQLPTDKIIEKTLKFNETSEVDISIKLYKELPKENALRVKVIRIRKITKVSWWKDIRDTPDPFLRLNVPESVSVEKETAHIRNNTNPEWNETHTFYLPPHLHHQLEVKLMDSNWLFSHEKLGVEIFDLDTLTLSETQRVTIKFENGSEVDLELTLFEEDTSLAYSLALCDEEKVFQTEICLRVFESMQTLLGDDAPRTAKEVPTVAMLFSGGGYRAMVGSSGAMKALTDTKLIDIVQYVGGLSGSSWYLSHLYSHQDWPSLDLSRQQAELKNSIDATHYQQFSLKRFLEAAKYMLAKRQRGQPISFTDFYGHVMMHIIMSDRMDSTLSDFAAKIKNGVAPMPLMTSVHVKETVSAEVFHGVHLLWI
ncbi:unnamed protein product [Owenia fusiformis]|uniref:Phospholipase A2 n=1 Tax=Owenia fusiformis TaxID=6347 RepID=A0A8S4P279_OWEFU|nr:unnamed protein product [Owenia fusiformis]